jgi:hypothetical protein
LEWGPSVPLYRQSHPRRRHTDRPSPVRVSARFSPSRRLGLVSISGRSVKISTLRMRGPAAV